jgi:hypothetical protein
VGLHQALLQLLEGGITLRLAAETTVELAGRA